MKSIRDIDVKNKRVLVRADFNIFLDDDKKIQDDFRIRATLPTIEYLLENKAKIILMSHLGKPKGKVVESLRLTPIQEKLSEYLNLPVRKAPDCVGGKIDDLTRQMKPGEILLLENLRFYPEEEDNDEEFARKLSQLGDVYINDAFGVCHRKHASVFAIAKFFTSSRRGAGLLLEKEINALSKVLENPERPLVVIIGGAKISTKIKLIRFFLEKADQVILGGALANTVLYSQGIAIGKSIIEETAIPEVQKLELTDVKLHIPVDVVVSVDKNGQAPVKTAAVGKTDKNEMILDIGPETEKLFAEIISSAKTIVWNGPMGLFEVEAFSHGTRAVGRAIVSNSEVFSIIGGGETTAFVNKLGLFDKFSHVSTGGGAMLTFLASGELPGIEALK